MKFKELKEYEPLEVVEVTAHREIPDHPDSRETRTLESKKIQMKIFTDGEIAKESEEVIQSIEEYYIGKRKYQYNVDTLKTKNIYFKNHSYVITYLISNEFGTVGNICGWFDVIKEVSIYLQNPKDKKALKCAKQAIREIANRNNSVNYSSIFEMLFSPGKDLKKFEEVEISKYVNGLKKIK